jgi:hypothetical protein
MVLKPAALGQAIGMIGETRSNRHRHFNKGPRIFPGRKLSSLATAGNTSTNDHAEQYPMIMLTYIVARIFQTFSTVSNYNSKERTERISMTFENEYRVLVGLS